MTGLMWTSEMSDPSGWTRDAQVTAQELGNLLDTSDRTIRRGVRWVCASTTMESTTIQGSLLAFGNGKDPPRKVSWDRQMIAFNKIARSFGVTMECGTGRSIKRILVEEERKMIPTLRRWRATGL